MRTPLVALAAIWALALAGAPASAGPDVLDGKRKTKVASIVEIPTATFVTASDPTDAQVLGCTANVQCGKLDFLYKPARGVKGDLTVMATWFYPTVTDVDLYLVGAGKILARCASTLGNRRFAQLKAASLKPGRTYTIVAFYAHSVGETLTIQASMPPVAVEQVTHEDTFNHRIADCG